MKRKITITAIKKALDAAGLSRSDGRIAYWRSGNYGYRITELNTTVWCLEARYPKIQAATMAVQYCEQGFRPCGVDCSFALRCGPGTGASTWSRRGVLPGSSPRCA